jgi:hypothetical protein
MQKKNSVKKSALPVMLLLLFLTSQNLSSQTIPAADRKKLQAKEDTLQQIARYMILDTLSTGRLLAYKDFVPVFLRALKMKNSFYYPFDSVLGISKLYAPDSSFRIFTWYLEVDDYQGYQKGFIQLHTKDGSLKGYSLFDNSDFEQNPNTIVCRDTNWIGAVYYNIIKTEYEGKKYYTLFGLDRHSVRSTKKWIEVLTFDENNRPVFGGPHFSFEEDSIKKSPQHRFSIEYKKDARTYVNYEAELQMILVDHLISEADEPESPWTLVPDGDYEGFKWLKGKWVHIDKVFTFALKDGEAPVDDPILDLKGKSDEKKLQERSDKNKTKKPGGNNQ